MRTRNTKGERILTHTHTHTQNTLTLTQRSCNIINKCLVFILFHFKNSVTSLLWAPKMVREKVAPLALRSGVVSPAETSRTVGSDLLLCSAAPRNPLPGCPEWLKQNGKGQESPQLSVVQSVQQNLLHDAPDCQLLRSRLKIDR